MNTTFTTNLALTLSMYNWPQKKKKKIAKHTLKILGCEHRTMFKVCLAIFQPSALCIVNLDCMFFGISFVNLVVLKIFFCKINFWMY